MNNYFKKAVERYNELLSKKQKEINGYLINPISKVDAEIIEELKGLLIKAGNNQATGVLEEYKGTIKDVDVLNQLKQCNIDTLDNKPKNNEEDYSFHDLKKQIEELKEQLENKRDFMIIDEHRIESRMIFGYSPKDKSTFEEEKYEITLNPCKVDATKLPLYANYTLTFYDEEVFNKTVKLIDKQMKESKVKFVGVKNKKGDGQ